MGPADFGLSHATTIRIDDASPVSGGPTPGVWPRGRRLLFGSGWRIEAQRGRDGMGDGAPPACGE